MKRIATLTLMALFLASSLALAQVVPTAKITGRVTDAQGAPLPGVSIQATSPKMVGKAATVSDAEGGFRLFSLPSGLYEVEFKLQGFKTLKREGIVVQLSQEIVLNVKLDQAAVEELITVVGMSPLIDVKSTVKGQVMTKEVFMSLPRSRNFDGLLSTAPGVQYDQNTGGLSVDGATGTENMWYMDGSDITQMHIGTLSQGAVMEMVEEVKVTASGYNAEFGGSMGGVINVITRSGGNAFHGDIMGYYNDNGRFMQGYARPYARWNPYNDNLLEYVNDDVLYYGNGFNRDPYKRYEAVFNLGGYILKDRLWFFASLNPQYAHQGASRYFLTDQPAPPAQPIPSVYYPFSQRQFWWNGQMKLTAAPVKGLRLSASFVDNFYKWRGSIPSRDGTSTKDGQWAQQGYDYPNWSGAVTADYSLGNNFLASFRGGYHMTNTNNQQVGNRFTTYYFQTMNTTYATDPFFVANPTLLHSTGWANYAGAWLVTDHYKLMKTSANLDTTYYMNLAGEHAWKAGVQMIKDHEDVNNTAPDPHVNIWWNRACTALAPYHVGDPAYDPSFRGTYGYYQIRSSFTSPYGYFWNIHRTSWALYLQDSWTVMGKLTINAGIRDESEYIPNFNAESAVTNPKPIKFGFGKKLAPRLGAVYDVFGDSSLKVFASFGIYYDVMKLYQAEGSFGGFKWKTDYYALNNPDFTQIAKTGVLTDANDQSANGTNTYMGTIDYRMPSFDTIDPNLKPVSQREISFGAEKKLMEDLSVSVRLVQKHLIRTIEDHGFISPGGELYYLGNPGSQYIQDALLREQGPGFWPEPKAKREYYGMNLTFEKRFSHNWQGGINYTLSEVKGNYGGLTSTDEGGRNSPNVERYFDFWYMMYKLDGTLLDGPLPQDRTHYIKAYGSYAFPFGLTIGATGYARSGLPMSTQLAMNNAYIYPNGYGDLGHLPWTIWADLYIEQTIKIAGKYNLGINLQVNNVTNTHNWITYGNSPTRIGLFISDAQILSKTYDWQAAINAAGDPYWKNLDFNKFNTQFGSWSTRLGFKFTF